MADLTKNAIFVTVKDIAKQTKIGDHKGYNMSDHKGQKSQITNIFRNSKFYKQKLKMADFTKKAISVTARDRA